jgi:high-affinity iron transporter
MKRVSKHLKRDIESRIESKAALASPTRAFWGVFAFALLMITREGMETALGGGPVMKVLVNITA